MKTFLMATAMLLCSSQALAQPASSESPGAPAKRTPGISEQELRALLASDMPRQFRGPPALGFSDDDLRFWAEKAKQAHRDAPVARGKATETYDVIVQIGHYPRTKGKTGGQGKYVSEQQIAALVGLGVIQKLSGMKANKVPIKALLVGADDYTKGLRSKIFLALHTDAADNKCIVGPSVGYQKVGDAAGMHNIALALAISLGIDGEKFMRDNYTADEAGYYAYSSFKTDNFKGLLEMSELTCPDQEKKLLTSAATLAANLATAIQLGLRRP